MTIAVDAVYEGNGVLKLVQPVALKEHEKVRVVIETEAPPAQDDDPTGWKAADEMIGFIKDAPPDMAEKHDAYLHKRHA